MYAFELDRLTTEYKVECGHKMCHPETCNCWDYRIYDLKGNNVFNTDYVEEVKSFIGANNNESARV